MAYIRSLMILTLSIVAIATSGVATLAMRAAHSAVAAAADLLSVIARGAGDHFHLVPTTPCSILETRRVGLA